MDIIKNFTSYTLSGINKESHLKFITYILIFQALIETKSMKKENYSDLIGLILSGTSILLKEVLHNLSVDINDQKKLTAYLKL